MYSLTSHGLLRLTSTRQVQNPVTGNTIDYYEINILPFTSQIYPGKGPAHLVGYDAVSPGPTFLIERGREAVVRFVNNATMDNSVHLHGSYSVSCISPGRDDYKTNDHSARPGMAGPTT